MGVKENICLKHGSLGPGDNVRCGRCADAAQEQQIREAGDAGYAQGVENTEARAVKRIDELEATIKKLEEQLHMPGTTCGWEATAKKLKEKYNKLLIYASKYKDHSSACSEWSGHEIQKLCDQCQEWEDLKP